MQRIKIIDYIKALFIIFVVVTHTEVIPGDSIVQLFITAQVVPGFMLLSGYTYALSSQKKTLRQMCNTRKMMKGICRYLVPAIIAYLIYLVGWYIRGDYRLTIWDMVYRFVMGLYGPGGYYCGIMLQFVLLAPVLFFIVRKYNQFGVLIIGVINFLFEIIVRIWNMHEVVYRVLIFKYLLVIAMGMYLCLNTMKKWHKKYLVLCWLIGVAYLILPYCTSYQYHLFTLWSETSMMDTFFIFPMMCVALLKFDKLEGANGIAKVIECIGKASYHIMYVQLIYFVGVKDALYTMIDLQKMGSLFEVVFALAVSLVGGVIFHKLDTKIFGFIYR